jgi:hypothetical protein
MRKKIQAWIIRLLSQIGLAVSSPSSDDLFAKAYDAFKTEFYRRSRAGATELARSRQRLAASPEFQRSASPFALRYKTYQDYVETIGSDFVACLKEIVIPHCGQLTPAQLQVIQQELRQVFSRRLEEAKQSESAFAASIGRSDNLRSVHLPVESLFNSTCSRYSEIVESTAKQSRLEDDRKRLKEQKDRRQEILKEVIKWGITGGGIIYLGKLILQNLGWIK